MPRIVSIKYYECESKGRILNIKYLRKEVKKTVRAERAKKSKYGRDSVLDKKGDLDTDKNG